jgi:hypothetical protein
MTSRRRNDRPVPFADVVRAELARPVTDEQDGRNVNRVSDRDLWDDQGQHWSIVSALDPDAADDVMADKTVRLGTYQPGARHNEWFAAAERDQVWRNRFRPRLHSPAAGRDPDDDLFYVPQLWTRIDGSRLLMVQLIC